MIKSEFFAPEARVSKWSKSMEQLHSSRWFDTADYLTSLKYLIIKLKVPMCLTALKTVAILYQNSNLAVTTHISINNY